MIKFTKEEISSCKKVAEKYRKEIKYGDWLLNEGGFAKVWPYRPDCKRTDVIPLWTISDCLEFFGEKGYRVDILETEGIYEKFIVKPHGHKTRKAIYKYGKTPLEACLKAVLAVLEEAK